MNSSKSAVSVNGRDYLWPDKPLVVVCIDGSEPAYIEQAITAGVMPWMKKIVEQQGTDLRANCVVPSFTNPNNISIVTGVPPVVHHGALGPYATVYVPDDADIESLITELMAIDGIAQVYDNAEGCERFELANDRMGDLILASSQDTVIGTTAARHDLSGLEVPLRSHGGLTEQQVPLIFSQPVADLDNFKQLRNFDIFNIALNHTMY